MESHVKVLGHSLHQSLVVLPLGTLIIAVVFEIVGLVTGNGVWHQTAFYMIGAGVVTGILAAIPGLIDWYNIPSGTRAKGIGLAHGLGNIALIALFAIAWMMRRGQPLGVEQPDWMALTLEFIAFGMGAVTAWLGGELVARLGVGVDKGANLNAPSSLTHLPADSPPLTATPQTTK